MTHKHYSIMPHNTFTYYHIWHNTPKQGNELCWPMLTKDTGSGKTWVIGLEKTTGHNCCSCFVGILGIFLLALNKALLHAGILALAKLSINPSQTLGTFSQFCEPHCWAVMVAKFCQMCASSLGGCSLALWPPRSMNKLIQNCLPISNWPRTVTCCAIA